MHDLTASSTSLSMALNQTFSLIHCLVLTIPWCDWCAMETTFCCKDSGITRRLPRRTKPSWTESSLGLPSGQFGLLTSSVLSFFVEFFTYSVVIDLGIAFRVTYAMYASPAFSRFGIV